MAGSAIYTLADNSQVMWEHPTGVVYSFFLPGTTDTHQEFTEWLGEGNTIDAFVPPIVDRISRYQMQHHLKNIGRLGDVRTLALTWTALSDARIEWEAGNGVAIDGPLMTALIAEFGFSQAQVESFFATASLI